MAKVRVAVWGSVGKSVVIETGLEPRVSALEAAFATLSKANTSRYHSSLLGLQVGNDHPQYPLKLARETIKGQWDFTQQVWAKLGSESSPGYSFTALDDAGIFGIQTAGDPLFSLVTTLLHLDGANGQAQPFTDSSSYARTTDGGITLSTTQKKFGSASADMTGSWARWAQAPEMGISTQHEWCLEGWVYWKGISAANSDIVAMLDFSGGTYAVRLYFDGSNTVKFVGFNGAGAQAFAISGLAGLTSGQWVHIAAVRHGNVQALYIDGVLQGTDSYSGDLKNITGVNAYWWFFGSGFYLDEFRQTIGNARYTAAFTPPTAPFPDGPSVEAVSITAGGDEKFRIDSAGGFGIGGASFGTLRQSFLSGGASASPTWSTLVHTDISDFTEAVQDVVGSSSFLIDTPTIHWTYDDTANTLAGNVPGAALTKTDDTNVTLTLGGSPTTALARAASLTLGWAGQLSVPRGGSGAATLTGYLKGNGTSAFTAVSTIPYSDISGTPTIPTGANPTASVGLAAVNGSAATFMRSDGAPALDQSITPTWTGLHKFTYTGGTLILGGTSTVNANGVGVSDAQHILDFANDATAYQCFRFSTYGTPGATLFENNVHFQRARGTLAVPTGLQSGDVLLSMGMRGHDGTGIANSSAAFRVITTENWSNTAHGIKFSIETTANGSTSRLARMEIGSNVWLPIDNEELQIGAGSDLRLYHDGTDSFIRNDTGALKISASGTTRLTVAQDGTLTADAANTVASILTVNGNINSSVNIILANAHTGGNAASRYIATADGTNMSMWALGASNAGILTGGPTGAQGIIRTLGAHPIVIGTANTLRVTIDGTRTTFALPFQSKGYTVATLPAGALGDRAHVTDASAPVFLAAVAGGGAVKAPVFFDGTNWVVG